MPQQQLTFVPVQLRREPPLARPLHDLQCLVQQSHSLFNLPGHLTCPGQEGDIMGHKHFCPGGAVSGGTVAQERRPLRHITIFDRDPAAKDRSLGVPKREALLGDDRNQLVYALTQGCIFSDKRM